MHGLFVESARIFTQLMPQRADGFNVAGVRSG